jgi:hypothetical protein
MIVERKRHQNMDEVMYPNDFEDTEDYDDKADDGEVEGHQKKKKKKLSKGTKPREIMCNGSLYRVILVYFLEELRPWVLQLGLNPTAVELGTAGFLHEPVFNKLASVYNDANNVKLNSFKTDNDIYIALAVQDNAPATFDPLSGLAFSQAMNFINKHYREAVQKRGLSGNHKPFYAYCKNRPYLLLYYDSITECGDIVLGALASPKLPEGVKRSSLDKKETKEMKMKMKAPKRESAGDKLVEVCICRFDSYLSVCCTLVVSSKHVLIHDFLFCSFKYLRNETNY